MDECAFCRIVAGEADAHRLYEDGSTIAFFDAEPATTGHALVVPKAHRESLFSGGESATTDVFRAVRTVARRIEATLDPDGFSVFHTSAGLVGNVTHAHVHLLPRYADDDVHVALARRSLAREDGERIAAAIRDGP